MKILELWLNGCKILLKLLCFCVVVELIALPFELLMFYTHASFDHSRIDYSSASGIIHIVIFILLLPFFFFIASGITGFYKDENKR